MGSSRPGLPAFRVLGVRVHAATLSCVIGQIEKWIAEGRCGRCVTFTTVHMIVEACRVPEFRRLLEHVDLSSPDGMPLVWLGRVQGFRSMQRACGPDTMAAFCSITAQKGYRHFFYGGHPGVADRVAGQFTRHFPGFQVCGVCSPPFRPPTPEEDAEAIAMINAAKADVLWVALGCPKQERWIVEHRHRLDVPVILAVGQAFDVHAGILRRAPGWMQRSGLEWLFRLLAEPRRLWRRYLVYNLHFLVSVFLEATHLKQFD